MKLIQTEDYLLLIEKVYGFKAGDWNYEEDNTIPVYKFSYDIDKYPGDKIIAYRKLNEEAKELDLPELAPFEGVDIEKLSEEYARKQCEDKYHSIGLTGAEWGWETALDFKAGYKAAQSKQFSLEDIKKAFEAGEEYTATEFLSERSPNLEKYIQSLSTQQLPVSFEPEYEITYKEYKNGKRN